MLKYNLKTKQGDSQSILINIEGAIQCILKQIQNSVGCIINDKAQNLIKLITNKPLVCNKDIFCTQN